jgi:signal transduction histidine kinase
VIATLVVLTCALVLAGWWLDRPLLTSIHPRWPAMAPNAALGLALLGAALAVIWREPVWASRRWLAAAAGTAAALLGVLTLAEYASARELGIDRFLIPGAAGAVIGGRPAPTTALALAALGLAVVLLDCRPLRGQQASQLLTVFAVLVALLALIGHACGVAPFYGNFSLWPDAGMALHTATLVALLGVGLLCARPGRGLVAILLGPGAGGVVARRLLLAPVLVPLVLGLLGQVAVYAGALNPALTGWLFALSNIVVSTLAIWWSAAALHRADAERARAEEQLRLAGERLAEANEELEAFNYSVSHDLRSPLLAADGFTHLLLEHQEPPLSDEVREQLCHIRESTVRMGRLIDDLLAFSRLGRQPLKRQLLSMADLVGTCLRDLSGERRGRRVEVSVGELPGCHGDPALLRQVWANVLSNAFKYTRGREVAVIEVGHRAASDGTAAGYFVRDNGAGFDMALAGKLFGAFQRLHRAEQFEGTGVGLSLVRRIVERHGGRVWAEAEPGQGATFYFTVEGAPAGGGIPPPHAASPARSPVPVQR